MLNIVKTYDGSLAPRESCRYIKGEFYIKNSQCFEIDGKWYRVNSGYIVYDHENKSYVLKNSSLLHGIIGIKEGEWETGYFSANAAKNATVLVNSNEIPCFSEKILIENGYKELQLEARDFFVAPDVWEKYSKKTRVLPYKRLEDLPYNCYNALSNSIKLHNLFYVEDKKIDEYTPLINYSKELSGTFGIEFETNSGRIPRRHLLRLGLIPLRDGSISGDEYTTIPFTNSIKDFRTVEDICDALQKYTTFDANNSMHVHIKTGEFSKPYFVFSYLLNVSLQDEIYSMFPKFYKKTSSYKASGKDYNKPLHIPKSTLLKLSERDDFIESTFNYIYPTISGGPSFADMKYSVKVNHPSDRDGSRKWQVDYRYHWCNYVPLLFGGKGTTEYRVHVPTFNIDKVLSWVYIINGISQYAETLAKELTKDNLKDIIGILANITLEQVMQSVYSYHLSGLLSNYINFRKNLRNFLDEQGDYIGLIELENDNVYNLYKSEILGDSFRRKVDKDTLKSFTEHLRSSANDDNS